ncbi:NAD(P)H-dependent oxidoreductase [Thaumasiovibrio subtropicus]|uniref:NAD(P)H-dependent oxidoreductase n=1 Tax=Thaumasiovibrio subtropicus TaxID=1891207 RepID=UPI000B35D93D|nr:NAD(P)H-dependent oxidoreductase [Thaumasiovibrio subtropicus]
MTAKTILVVSAHPEPTSLTHFLAQTSIELLKAQGHTVLESDLYAMNWKSEVDGADFPSRVNPERLTIVAESQHAFANGHQAEEVALEQEKLLAADAVIFHFPLWWYGMPAIMKGWFDRVYAYGFAYGYKGLGNALRYGDGVFKGKRAILCVPTGGPEIDYSPRSINGPLDQLLFPITHGCLFYPGFSVLKTHAVYGAAMLETSQVDDIKHAWQQRLDGLFDEAPIPFRAQNSGDFPDQHALAAHILPGEEGIDIHLDATRAVPTA